eukprot:1305265-Alexandrium_andersonii.AAC.1
MKCKTLVSVRGAPIRQSSMSISACSNASCCVVLARPGDHGSRASCATWSIHGRKKAARTAGGCGTIWANS